MAHSIRRRMIAMRRAAPFAAWLLWVATAPALGAPGDLDPDFAYMGRTVPSGDHPGPAWALRYQADGRWILAGGLAYRYRDGYDFPAVGAAGFLVGLRLSGAPDPNFASQRWSDRTVADVVVQSDGRIVVAGLKATYGSGGRSRNTPFVSRLATDGAAEASLPIPFGTPGFPTSLALDADERIVIAFASSSGVALVRLRPSGEIDSSFADSGQFLDPSSHLFPDLLESWLSPGVDRRPLRVISSRSGGYRVLLQDDSTTVPRCRILALDPNGAVDLGFGDLGYAGQGLPEGSSLGCRSIVETADGRLIVTGTFERHAFAVRLQANGAVDPTFDSGTLGALMSDARAVALDDLDGVVVAGDGPGDVSGAPVVRLHSDGSLDASFGNAGIAWIDVPNASIGHAVANEAAIGPDGKLLVAGASMSSDTLLQTAGFSLYQAHTGGDAFAARLALRSGADGPGVIGFMRTIIQSPDSNSQLTLTVRRTGGKSGPLNIRYAARDPADDVFGAREGEDFEPLAGELQWADGDSSDRQIVVALKADNVPEDAETFQVELEDNADGLVLGSRVATISLPPDGAPAGLLSIGTWSPTIGEGASVAQFLVRRNYYASGPVSVVIRLVAGSAAAGADFAGDPVTVQWADGDRDEKLVDIPITNDSKTEADETFSATLTDATGGALIGPRSAVTVTIVDDDAPLPTGGSSGGSGGGSTTGSSGGGRIEWVTLALLISAVSVRQGRRVRLLPSPRSGACPQNSHA